MAWTRRFATQVALLTVTALACSCTTSPLGRRQLVLYPEADMAVMGAQAFERMKQEVPVSGDVATSEYVQCVARAITTALDGKSGHRAWEVLTFEDESANAFALPGAKIGVHTGLLEVAANQDQLAVVIGHEVAHVLAHHSNERVSTGMATQLGLIAAQEALSAGVSFQSSQQAMALLGLGEQRPGRVAPTRGQPIEESGESCPSRWAMPDVGERPRRPGHAGRGQGRACRSPPGPGRPVLEKIENT